MKEFEIKKNEMILTDRLVIKPIEECDIIYLTPILKDETVKQTYMLPDFESEEKAVALARRLMVFSHSEEHYVRGIYLENEIIGFCNDVEVVDKEIEIGYVIAPARHNQGYATEMLKAVIVDLKDRGFERVVTGAFEENQASLRVMQKSGMKLMEKEDTLEYRGKVHKCIYYSL